MGKNMNMRGIAAGIAAGLCNGLFGAGGGMVAVIALKDMCAFPAEKAHASAISIMLPLTAISGAMYAMQGNVDYRALLFVAPALTLGGFVGAKLVGRLKRLWLNRIFSALMVASAIWMLI
ncbi:MAG: sulfite exporter TauE/SafE family protein [Clostridia bacterium]